ncbi:MAG: hypothetical protein QGG40_19915 [Myxococcota bacterium]|jgi:hypothetical protein|nr:hypothetical protein [Myxococcota bacterium]
MLAGLLIGIAAVWGWYALNRLWQHSLREDASEAIQATLELGLMLSPPGYRARIVAQGNMEGQQVRVEWRGGAFGTATILVRDGARQRHPLVCSQQELALLLNGSDPKPVRSDEDQATVMSESR